MIPSPANSTIPGRGTSLLTLAVILLVLSTVASAQSCIPGIVTCCLTMNTKLVRVYVNNADVTWSVQPDSARLRANPKVIKRFTFLEPRGPVKLAIKGARGFKRAQASFQIRCSCTRASSPWNQVESSLALDWRGVPAAFPTKDIFPPNWFTLDFTGGARITQTSAKTTSSDSMRLCGGGVIPPSILRIPTSRVFYGATLVVNSTCPLA